MKTNFVCNSCGYTTTKWYGRCPECTEWNTLSEQVIINEKVTSKEIKAKRSFRTTDRPRAVQLKGISKDDNLRFKTGMGEFDRVLGGGLVVGSTVLLSGDPGIGKSTLLLQICQSLDTRQQVLYITGEESLRQIKLRADRVGVDTEELLLLAETNLDEIIPQITTINPAVVIIDSIQTLYNDSVSSSPGSVTQVKQSAMHLINIAKTNGISIIIVGHVNKDGAIAGPKVLEHMVDVVLYFEGDSKSTGRFIRAMKNRYGSTNEIGVFEMGEFGLSEITNPSELLLEQRPKNVSGSCAVCILEGSRPLIAEVQALCTLTYFPSPRRMSSGVDYNRLSLLLAVLEKRLGIYYSKHDVYLNVAGGLKISDTSCDTAIALSLISSIKDLPVPEDLMVLGEIGLSGEVRNIFGIEQRIKESARLGFTRIAIPHRSYNKQKALHKGIDLLPLRTVFDLLKLLD